MSRANMKRQLYQQGGEIFPRLNELGSQVSTAEQTLQNISQRLESAENQLGNSSMSANFNIYQRPLNATPGPGFLGRPLQIAGASTGILGALNSSNSQISSLQQAPVFSGLSGQIANRQNYGLGSFVKKTFKKAKNVVKKVAKSPLGKAAIAVGIGSLFAPGAAAGLFGKLGGMMGGAGKFLLGTPATIGRGASGFLTTLGGTPGLLGKMGLTKGAGALGLTALGKTAAIGAGSALLGGLFAGKTEEEIAQLKQNPGALEAYLRDYYTKLNPSAEAEEVDEFVRTNLFSSGGRAGFREGELAISPDQPFSLEKRPNTILPDLDAQILAQAGPLQAVQPTSENGLYADVLEYLKRPASDIVSGTKPAYGIPTDLMMGQPLMPSEKTPEYLAEYYDKYLPTAPSTPLGFEEYIYGKYGPGTLFSPYTGALVPEDYYDQNLSGEKLAEKYGFAYNSGGRVGFKTGTAEPQFITEGGETYRVGPGLLGELIKVMIPSRKPPVSSAENVVYDSALDDLAGLRDPFQPAITPEAPTPVAETKLSEYDYSGITEPAKQIAKKMALDAILKKGAAQSGILGTIFGNVPQLMALKGVYDLYKYQTSKPSSKEEMVYGTDPGSFSNIFFNRKNRAYGSNSKVEKASMIENLPVRKNQAGVKELDLRKSGGFIPPVGIKEKADDIPAMLSNNEFVFTADAVRGAGNGDINKGAQRMYDTMKKLEKGGKV
jgi:hypothetical protein